MGWFRRGAAVAMALMLAGCGGGGPSDAEVIAAVRAVLAGTIAQAPTAQSPDALPPAARQAVMAVDVRAGAKTPNGDGSFDVTVHVSCAAPPAAGATQVAFTQPFDVLRSGQGWSLSAIGGKALAKMVAPCLVVPARG